MEDKMVAERKDHVFKELTADDPEQLPTEIESYCVNCGENGNTRLLMTKIPHYKEVILMSFFCDHCGFQNNEIQSGGKIQEEGVTYKVLIERERDLNRQVVKSDFATVSVPEIELEIPPSDGKGEITNIEGVLRRVIAGLQQDQPVRRALEPEDAEKIDTFIKRIEDLLNLNQPFHIVLTDPSGNSFVENPMAPRADPAREVVYFVRTPEQDRMLGIYTQEELRDRDDVEKAGEACALPSPTASTSSSTSPLLRVDGAGCGDPTSDEATVTSQTWRQKEEIVDSVEDLGGYSENPSCQENKEDLRDEVLTFHTNCPECNAPAATNMKVTSIPHFKEVVIMATVCDYCGHKTNEVKSGGGIEPKGKRITLRVTEISDLSRDVLKSETCALLIPELELEMGSHALGGRFTTLEGLLRNVLEQIEQNPLYGGVLAVGDSATDDSRQRLTSFKEQLTKLIEGESFPFSIVLDDPAGNSYLQNVYAPDDDPEMEIIHYERTWDQNESMGINDMKVEGYEADSTNKNETKASCADAHHLMEIGRAGRHLLTRDDPPSTVTSPLNHPFHEPRRHSKTRSTKSVSSPMGPHGTRPESQAGGTIRTGSASPDDDAGSRQ